MKWIPKPFLIRFCLAAEPAMLFPFNNELFSQQNEKILCGADNNPPFRSEYFTCIKNTGEGSAEKQTLINLDFFKWLHDEYGMALDFYGLNAGNMDKGKYYDSNKKKFEIQFPHAMEIS